MNIRKASVEDAAGIAHVHVASWKTTYAGIMPDEVLQNLDVQERGKMWTSILTTHKDRNSTYVATTEEGTVIGFASGGKAQSDTFGADAELYAIYLLEERQGKGVGRELFLHVVAELQEKQYESMVTWVVKDNPAVKFYESFGPELLMEEYVEDLHVTEVAYIWRDLQKVSREE
jgi:L-amino acid N-acyltransferase YncA